MPNQLVQCVSGGNTSQFIYGADGLRRTSIVNGNPVHSVLDSGMMVRELRAEGQELRATATYLIGPRGPEYRLAKLRAEGQELRASATYLIGPRGPEYRLAKLRAEGQELRASATYLIGPRGPEYRPARLRAESPEPRADEDSGNRTASAKPRHGSVSGCDVYGLVRAGDNGTSRHKRRPELVEGFVGSLGHTSEDETGLIYMRARWMDPALGRFISEDPARDGANWFDYCRGNPVNAVDPDGEHPLLLAALGLAGVGFLAGFLSAILGDYLNGDPVNWANALSQGGIWAGAGLAGGLIAAGVGGVSLAGIGGALLGLGALSAIVGCGLGMGWLVFDLFSEDGAFERLMRTQ